MTLTDAFILTLRTGNPLILANSANGSPVQVGVLSGLIDCEFSVYIVGSYLATIFALVCVCCL